jgi:hypothetical protein
MVTQERHAPLPKEAVDGTLMPMPDSVFAVESVRLRIQKICITFINAS